MQFASTSKITHAGAGVAFASASTTVLDALDRHYSVLTVGHDKVNQLRHVKFLQGRLAEHMAAHAAIIRPKFELVEEIFPVNLAALASLHGPSLGAAILCRWMSLRVGPQNNCYGEGCGPYTDACGGHLSQRA